MGGLGLGQLNSQSRGALPQINSRLQGGVSRDQFLEQRGDQRFQGILEGVSGWPSNLRVELRVWLCDPELDEFVGKRA